jgi:hypothetical protein
MFVDWEKTWVKGVARAKAAIDAGIESPRPDVDMVDTTLWY